MDGFIDLFTQLIIESGIKEEHIFYKLQLELSGFFRPTKEWDLLVIKDGHLVVAIEAKSASLKTGKQIQSSSLVKNLLHKQKKTIYVILNLFQNPVFSALSE